MSSDSEPDLFECVCQCWSQWPNPCYHWDKQVKATNGNQHGSTQIHCWEDTFKQLWPVDQWPSVSPAKGKLRTYTDELIPVLGIATINVNYHNQCKVLELLVTAGARPTLIDRDWLHDLKLWEQQKLMTNKIMQCYNAGGLCFLHVEVVCYWWCP